MAAFNKKVDFVALITVNMANSNGDPLDGNRPRTDYNGYGEISDVCIKRKIRNRMQDLGQKVFVQSEDRSDDDATSLAKRAEKDLGKPEKNETKDHYAKKACEKYLDVRAFGQVFAFFDKFSCGVRGPVSIHQAVSVSPVDIISQQITKSVNGTDKEGGRASDTMGMKHMVRFGLYVLKGSINVQLAEKTGFTDEDADILKECVRTLFRNDASSARPDGSMEINRLYWFKHNCKDGQYSSARIHRSVHIVEKNPGSVPSSIDDYEITVEPLEGLEMECLDGE